MVRALQVLGFLALSVGIASLAAPGCSASGSSQPYSAQGTGGQGGTSADAGPDGTLLGCNTCIGNSFKPCDENGTPGADIDCGEQLCAPGLGCRPCAPGANTCVGNEVHACTTDGQIGDLVETCDPASGKLCGDGKCGTPCDIAADQASNVGCEFWAVDLDQQDFPPNDPASAPWGVALSNAGQTQANVTIEMNNAPVGQPAQLAVVQQVSVNPGDLQAIVLPTRELDCGVKPNDYGSPGTCLSSNAFRITSSSPIIVYQFNVFTNTYSNDASLLLPTSALGRIHRIINWVAGHPVPTNLLGQTVVDRSYVTVVGTKPNTQVKIRPSWRTRGNPPIAASGPGGEIVATIGPFDVLNVETDDGTFQDNMTTIADLTGTIVEADQPIAVFSGVESTGVPGGVVDIPTYSGWNSDSTCCLDHLEEQMFPVESVGQHYVITRSPIRSTSGYREPDVLRFMGVAEPATVTTNLPAPDDSFTLQPGEVRTTYAQDDIVVSATKPVMIGQLLISQGYVDGPNLGDPSLTVFPPVEQYRTEYVILTPSSWSENWVVISAEVGADVSVDGNPTTSCTTESAGTLEGAAYESRRCALEVGVHRLSGAKPFGIIAYGYGAAGSYAFAGGADVKRIYNPPPLQ